MMRWPVRPTASAADRSCATEGAMTLRGIMFRGAGSLPGPMTAMAGSEPKQRAAAIAVIARVTWSNLDHGWNDAIDRSSAAGDGGVAFPDVEPLPRLLAQTTCRDVLAEDARRGEARAKLLLEVLGDRQAHVETDEVGQLERPHRVAVS